MLVIRNDEEIKKLFWQRLNLPYIEYDSPSNTRIYGPTDYFDFGIRSSEDLQKPITPEGSRFLMTREEQMRITHEIIKQVKKMGL